METHWSADFRLLKRIVSFEEWRHDRQIPLSVLSLARRGFINNAGDDLIKCSSCDFILYDFGNAGDKFVDIDHVCPHGSLETDRPATDDDECLSSSEEEPDEQNAKKNNYPSTLITTGILDLASSSVRESGLSNASGRVLSSVQEDIEAKQNQIKELEQIKARYPALADPNERTNSFSGHEEIFSHCKASIEELVEAGFYYIGPHDDVRCFHCGGGLKNFTWSDDPWLGHNLWFNDCKYVQLREAQQQLEALQRLEQFHSPLDLNPAPITSNETRNTRPTERRTARSINILKGNLDKLLRNGEAPVLRNVVESIISRKQRRRRVENQRSVEGNDSGRRDNSATSASGPARQEEQVESQQLSIEDNNDSLPNLTISTAEATDEFSRLQVSLRSTLAEAGNTIIYNLSVRE